MPVELCVPGLWDSVAANLPDGAVVVAVVVAVEVAVEADSRIDVHLWNDHDDLTRASIAPALLRIHRC